MTMAFSTRLRTPGRARGAMAGSTIALVLGLSGALPWAGQAQHEARWFVDVGTGWSWPVEHRQAFEGGRNTRLGVGLAVTPGLAVHLAVGAVELPYADERFGELFVIADPGVPDAGGLGAEIFDVSAGIEWSPSDVGEVRPLLGAALGYERLDAGGYFDSPAWARCPLGSRFVVSTDPTTGESTLSVDDSPPEPGCAELRQDLSSVTGQRLALATSVGLAFGSGWHSFAVLLRYAHAMTSVTSGTLSMQLAWRLHL